MDKDTNKNTTNRIPPIYTEYQLVDADGGGVFVINVPQAEALVLDYDKDRRFRLLKSLKEKKITPSFNWDVSYVLTSPPQKQGPSTSGQSSQPLATSSPILIRATGKTGGVWKDDRVTMLFLQECFKRRTSMQGRTIDDSVYQDISNALFVKSINYSSGQLRNKMKSLRRQFVEAKGKGLHGGSQWKFYNLMESIFPVASPQLAVEDECALGLEHFDSVQSLNHSIREVTLNGSEEMLQQFHNSEQNNTVKFTADNKSTSGASLNGSVLQLNNSTCYLYQTVNVDSEDKHDEQPNSGFGYDSLLWNDNDDIIVEEVADENNNYKEHLHQNSTEFVDLSIPEDNINAESIIVEPERFNWDVEQPRLLSSHAGRIVVAPDSNNNLNSPSRKQQKRNDGLASNSPRKTPSKTPKRRVATPAPNSPRKITSRTPKRRLATNAELVWPPQLVQLFLKECLKEKKKMQQAEISISTWKVIAEALDSEMNWQNCRGKYSSIYEFFTGTLLRTGGKLGGVTCPYWTLMCDIHDFPHDYIQPEEPLEGNNVWSPEAIELLIQLYKVKKPLFDGTESHVRHITLYKEIAETMTHFAYSFTAKQCKDKFSDLKKDFFREYDLAGGTGGVRSVWEWYDAMEGVFGGTATLQPPFTYSSGTSVTYDVRGGTTSVATGTRTRIPSTHEPVKEHHGPTKNGPKKKATFKSKQSEMQERQMEQRNTFVDEFRLMREAFTEQVQVLKMLANKQNSGTN